VQIRDSKLDLPAMQTARVIVRDSYGRPVADASLDAHGGAGRFSWTVDVRTSALGVATVPKPVNAAGPVAVSIKAEGFGSFRDEINLAVSQDTIVSLEAAGTIRGTVIDHTPSVQQATLRLWKLTNSRDRVLQQTVSGSFALPNLSAGAYEVDLGVSHLGELSVGPVTLNPGQDLDLGLVDISATAILEGDIHDAGDRPLANVRVRLARPGLPSDDIPEARTNANGHFRFAKLIPGEYYPELFSTDVGWRTFPHENVVLYSRQAVSRSFTFTPSGCSLRITLEGGAQQLSATYSITLPVTDGPMTLTLKSGPQERFYGSVPCGGFASVRRVDGEGEQYSTPLELGEANLIVPVTASRVPVDVRVLIGERPLSGASLWTMPRDSSALLTKARSMNVTDESGHALLSLSSSTDLSLYLQVGRLLSVVEVVEFTRRAGSMVIELPSRTLVGVARDPNGRPVAAVSVSGSRLPDRATGRNDPVPSTVTMFKGVTESDGRFEVGGLAPGRWSVQLNKATSQPAMSYVTEIELPTSQTGKTTLDVKLSTRQ
jgi:hypothetical protein